MALPAALIEAHPASRPHRRESDLQLRLMFHGTHVLGIIAALDNSYGVVGMAPGLYDYDVYVSDVCEREGTKIECYSDYIIEALDQAAGWRVEVVNISLTLEGTTGLADAVARAWQADVLLVASAGHTDDPAVFPAAYDNVIGVSGVVEDLSYPDQFVHPPKKGPHVDLTAPFCAYSTISLSGYTELCGTSMATPHVTGTAALLRSNHPTWSNQQVVDRLFDTARDLGVAGRDDTFGHGFVDAAAALGVARVD